MSGEATCGIMVLPDPSGPDPDRPPLGPNERLLQGMELGDRAFALLRKNRLVEASAPLPSLFGPEAFLAGINGSYRVLPHLGVVLIHTPAAPPQDTTVFSEKIPNLFELELRTRLVRSVTRAQPLFDAMKKEISVAEAFDSFWHLTKTGLGSRWNKNEGANVLVGMLDTGFDLSSDEMRHTKCVGFCYVGECGELTPLPADKPPYDLSTHGTRDCSLITGKTLGVAPKCSVAASVFPTESSTASWLAGLEELVGRQFPDRQRAGVDVIFSSSAWDPVEITMGELDILRTVRQRVLRQGILTVEPIGNGLAGQPVMYPACMDGSFAIGATTPEDVPWMNSRVGPADPPRPDGRCKPDLYAPGENVRVISGGSALPDMHSGTCLAAALVTGAAALVLGRLPHLRGNPKLLQEFLTEHCWRGSPKRLWLDPGVIGNRTLRRSSSVANRPRHPRKR